MPKIEAQESPDYESDEAFKKAVKEYKNLCTIRRDLRKVDQICTYIISLHDSIKSENSKLAEVGNSLFLVSAAAMHVIVLYGRWFKATEGKTRLVPKNFFSSYSKELSVHNAIIDHRDKYVAHNQLDLLGLDRVWINTDDGGDFVSTESDFLEQLWPQDCNNLDMGGVQNCVHIVHNKIDAELIPKAQKKLDRRCKLLFRK